MIKARETLMQREAAESAACVARQLARNEEAVRRLADALRVGPPSFVMTCARGSSESAACFAKYVIETELGVVVAAAAPSVQSVYGAQLAMAGALVLIVSQSARSPDLLRVAEGARDAGAMVVALVNSEGTALHELAHHIVPLHAGLEQSVTATKSYICSVTALLHIVAEWKADGRMKAALADLPGLLRHAWDLDWSAPVEHLRGASSMFVVGRGPGYAMAREAALKLKESCAIQAEALSAAELRHGPISLIRDGFPVLCISQNDASRDEMALLAGQLRGRGAMVLEAGGVSPPAMPMVASHYPPCTAIAFIQSFYRMANSLALLRGFDPDRPYGLVKVTETL